MKTITLMLIAILLSLNILAQVPNKISYQAVVRDSKGDLVRNQQVRMKISILLDSETGTPIYMEIHDPISNENGLVSLEIGNGRTTDVFAAIDWSSGIYFLKTETDPKGNSNFTITGTSQILSVPYAFHAKTVENDQVDDADADPNNELQTLSLNGSDLSLSDGGGTIAIPSSSDNWGTQTVSTDATLLGKGTGADPLKVAHTAIQPDWANIQNMPGGFTDNTDDVNDNDSDPDNEIQTLSITGNDLSISDGNTISLPESAETVWSKQGNNAYFNGGKVGIGIDTPAGDLVVHTGAEPISSIAVQTNASGGTIHDGLQLFINSDNEGSLINFENKNLHIGTNGKMDMTLIPDYEMDTGDKIGSMLHFRGNGLFMNEKGGLSIFPGFNGANEVGIGYYSQTGYSTNAIFSMGKTKFSGDFSVLNGKVGFGTEMPAHNLTIKGSDDLSQLSLQNSASGNTAYDGFLIGIGNSLSANACYMWNYENGGLGFGANNELRMQINADGNIVIGDVMANPEAEELLNIVGANPRILIEASSSNPEINFKNAGDAPADIWSIYKDEISGDLKFFQAGNKLTIQKNTGNVGIGTDNPKEKLHVSNGNILLDKGHPLILSNNQYSSYVTTVDNDLFISNYASGNIRFTTSPNLGTTYDRMYINKYGYVGIGTGSPTAVLHVKGDGSMLCEGTYGNGSIPKTGSGDRMMWYPKKSAFRAGYANGDQWDDAKIGRYSVAMGLGTEASGDWGSTAFGEDTKASGTNSFATGSETQATGNFSTSMGRSTIASGEGSTAMGWVTTASGSYSTALGWSAKATGLKSTALGTNTIASNFSSTALGAYTLANGYASTAMGWYTNASGYSSTAIGTWTLAESYHSTTIGSFNIGGGTPDKWILTDPLFEIGNGQDRDNRSNALTVLKNGRIGIGIANPGRLLHLSGANPRILIEATSSNPEINFKSAGDADFDIWSIYKNTSSGDLQFFQNGNKLTIQKNTGYVGIGTPTPQGRLDVNGAIYQRGGILHADYVFEADYQLESIEKHAEFMWKNKHLPAIPKATKDDTGEEIVEVGSHRKGIVEELEKAHIYISQLEQSIKELTLRLEKIENAKND